VVEKELKIVGCRRKDLAGRRSRENMLKSLVLGVVGRGIGDFFCEERGFKDSLVETWRRDSRTLDP